MENQIEREAEKEYFDYIRRLDLEKPFYHNTREDKEKSVFLAGFKAGLEFKKEI